MDHEDDDRLSRHDAPVDWALLVTGYNGASLESVAANELSRERIEQHAAADPVAGLYRIAYTLTDTEVAAYRTHATIALSPP